MSKGSAPRPLSVSDEEYAARWDAIFRRDLPDDKPPVKTYFNGQPNYVRPVEQPENNLAQQALELMAPNTKEQGNGK